MKHRSALLIVGMLLAGCAQTAASGQQAPDPVSAARRAIVPLVDAHQHLLSPAATAIINGPAPLPAVPLPGEVASLLRSRGELRSNKAALAALYTSDAILLLNGRPSFGWVQGPGAIAENISEDTRFTRGYRFVPGRYGAGESTGFVAGQLVWADTGEPFGYFQLSLKRDAAGVWRIATETPTYRTRPSQAPITAAQLVALLDSAGIRRAVVLSGAFTFGGSFDVERARETAAERYAKVRGDNDWTAEQVARFPDRLVAFCSFNPLEDYALAELERCAANPAFRGLKLHLDESRVDLSNAEHVGKVRRIFRAADARRFPIVVHPGNNRTNGREHVNILLNEIIAAAPHIPIQVAHLWGGGAFADSAATAYAEAVEGNHPATKNLYFDVAEVPLMALAAGDRAPAVLHSAAARIRQIGLGRIFFGSDIALHLRPREAWDQFRAQMPLTDDELRTIANNVPPYMR